MRIALILLIAASWQPTTAFCSSGRVSATVTHTKAVRAIVGEAAGEPYLAKVAIGCAIRNRGTMRGIYGLAASHVDRESRSVFNTAHRSWEESARRDITGGCTMFGGIIDDRYFRSLGLRPVMTIGSTRFYRSDYRIQTASKNFKNNCLLRRKS